MKSPITKPPALLFLCLYPPPLKLQVIVSFFLTALLFSFLSLVCFCSSHPVLFWSPGSLVILVVSPCFPHRRVLFCSGATRAVSLHYAFMGPPLYLCIFNMICKNHNEAIQTIEATVPEKETRKIYQFQTYQFCRFTDLQKGRVLGASSASDQLPERCGKNCCKLTETLDDTRFNFFLILPTNLCVLLNFLFSDMEFECNAAD